VVELLDGSGVGHVTLSADDIVNYSLDNNLESFDFVLNAEKAAEAQNNESHILLENTGRQRLKTLMQ
jgi:hypothetical protein